MKILSFFVMPGLVPGIHVFLFRPQKKGVDGRVKPGHDGLLYG
jgi:D-alanyl-D-alanine dipeptidase